MISEEMKKRAADGWEAQLRKGCLELAILAVLWQEKLYGLEIIRALGRYPDLIVAEGTIYPILNRLKVDELLHSEWVEADSGHPRKYYWLSEAGRNRAREMAAVWLRFSANLTDLIGGINDGGES